MKIFRALAKRDSSPPQNLSPQHAESDAGELNRLGSTAESFELASSTELNSPPELKSGQGVEWLANLPANTTAPSASTAQNEGSADADSLASGSDRNAATELFSWLKSRLARRSVPSWLVSMMLHVAILMMLAAIQMEPVRDALGVVLSAEAGDASDVGALDEQIDMSGQESFEAPQPALDQALAQSATTVSSQPIELPSAAEFAATDVTVDVGKISSLVENILPSSSVSGGGASMASSLMARSSAARKSELLERFGGNAASEKSVALALKWISDHQDRSGGWTFGHSRVCRGGCKDDGDLVQSHNAATALALLPFLGAGQTHKEGKYRRTVHDGLKFLISRMKVTAGTTPTGSWHESGGSMYSHGLAAIVICEAYAMTRDPELLQPAQLALNYIAYAQDPKGGGWRYQPKQRGDTSVVGWQLMALKSGAMGNLQVQPEVFRKASGFLDAVSVNDGAFYGYDEPTSKIEGRGATTAVGLLCRMYLGWKKDQPGMVEGVKHLSKLGPSLDDLYYSYYATQVLRQFGGPEWEKWNTAMRDGLIKSQETEGHAAGSWYSAKGHNLKGGRLYCTALSAMILEVYYRHMPLYTDKSSDDDFEL